jgi:hypothetical protein
METPPEIERRGIDLANHLLDAMKAWADRQETSVVSAAVPLVALRTALVECLEQFPLDRRRLYADDFIASLNKYLQRAAS